MLRNLNLGVNNQAVKVSDDPTDPMECLKTVSENLGGSGAVAVNVGGGNVSFAAKKLSASFTFASAKTFSRPAFLLGFDISS